MLAIERRAEIMKIINIERSVRVNVLSEKFEVAEETIRRDLDKLEKEGVVKKTYGGAVVIENVSNEQSFLSRQKVNITEKRIIASYADDLIKDGETIFIDMSTTALEFIKNVSPDKHITVLTNSLTAMVELSNKTNIKLINIGGEYDAGSNAMLGSITHRNIKHFYADKTLFSVKAVMKNRGAMDSKEELAEIKRIMIEHARESIMLLDSSKFDRAALVQVVPMDQIHQVITDYDMNKEWLDYFESCEVKVTVVNA